MPTYYIIAIHKRLTEEWPNISSLFPIITSNSNTARDPKIGPMPYLANLTMIKEEKTIQMLHPYNLLFLVKLLDRLL